MKIRYILLFLLFIVATGAWAQSVEGIVYGKNSGGERSPLPGATVVWIGSTQGTTTNAQGHFSIPSKHSKSKLVVSFIGYQTDTVDVKLPSKNLEVELAESGITIGAVTVRSRQGGSYISKLSSSKVEVITQGGLQKLACCNLSESFENSASVTVGFADAVTGARQIEMLGLSGTYSQLLEENISLMRGIPSVYGLSAIPGSWMQSIQVSKGAASVVNGYESTTGQINIEYKKPETADPLFVNLYGDSDARLEANIDGGGKISKNWSAMGMAHISGLLKEQDHNMDGFMDSPLSQQTNLFGRLSYLGSKIESRFGFKFLQDERTGGEMGFRKSQKGSQENWGMNMLNRSFSVFNKTGIPFAGKPYQSLGIISSYTHYTQDGFFGLRDYSANQNSAYLNLLFQSIIGNTNHKYVVGSSFTYDNVSTKLENLPLSKQEVTPGLFAEYTYTLSDKLNFVAGSRVDHNSRFGWIATPRLHVKYTIIPSLVVRASAGRGFHSSNPIAENIGILASSRAIVLSDKIGLEKAWNFGFNITKDFKVWGDRHASISLDYYRTDFQNQLVVDQQQDATHVYLYNLQGKSYSNSFQVDMRMEPLDRLELYLAYRLNDVNQTIGGKLQEKPLVNRYRGLANISYATKFEKWKFDFTAQLNGKSKIPDMSGYPQAYRMGEYSPTYPILLAQITKKYRSVDLYVGGENLLNYRQKYAIVGADDPFGPYFDSSFIWGPLMGRKIYAGLRWTISKD